MVARRGTRRSDPSSPVQSCGSKRRRTWFAPAPNALRACRSKQPISGVPELAKRLFVKRARIGTRLEVVEKRLSSELATDLRVSRAGKTIDGNDGGSSESIEAELDLRKESCLLKELTSSATVHQSYEVVMSVARVRRAQAIFPLSTTNLRINPNGYREW